MIQSYKWAIKVNYSLSDQHKADRRKPSVICTLIHLSISNYHKTVRDLKKFWLDTGSFKKTKQKITLRTIWPTVKYSFYV